MVWREELHPRVPAGRHGGGRFTSTSNPSRRRRLDQILAAPAAASIDELLDAFHEVSSAAQPDDALLHAMYRELARREKSVRKRDRLPRSVEQDITAGNPYYQSVLVDRRLGEPLEAARRRAYQELVAAELLQAEDATRGHLLTRDCRDVHPADLWSMPAARARKCASEELKRWWEDHGGRRTYTQFRADLVRTPHARRAAQHRALAGSGKDFGL